MDRKLFKRLTESMQQHAKIARGELPPSRATSRDSSDDMSPELLASIARGLSDADAGRLVSIEDVMNEFGIDEWTFSFACFDSAVGTLEDMGQRFVSAWHRLEKGEKVRERHPRVRRMCRSVARRTACVTF